LGRDDAVHTQLVAAVVVPVTKPEDAKKFEAPK